MEPPTSSIIVRGLAARTSEELLGYYFENTRKSGGGEVKEVQLTEEGTAIVTFEDPEGNIV